VNRKCLWSVTAEALFGTVTSLLRQERQSVELSSFYTTFGFLRGGWRGVRGTLGAVAGSVRRITRNHGEDACNLGNCRRLTG